MKDSKVSKIIKEEFNTRLDNMVISYIMDKGMAYCIQITDKDIEEIEENGLMTKEFIQSLVKCSRRVCQECEWIEIIEYIRLHLWCTPTIQEVYLYKEDFPEESFYELLKDLDLDEEEVPNGELKLYAVVDRDFLEEQQND